MNRKALYIDAVRKWGMPLQMGMLMEECAELIKATNKVMRKNNDQTWLDFAEEMADVEIMIEQLKTTIGHNINGHLFPDIVASKRHDKILRLSEMLKKEGA